ncbi:MAG: DUF3592 domain-containing protein [Lachnospiraceae bacterium]|nr:DUF3592 domain-containing protein [Lachnospiraceae bacterium]
MNKLAAFYRDYGTAGFLIPVGLIVLVFGIFTFSAVNRIKNFPRTDAAVTRTELYEQEYTDKDGRHEATYTVFVKYTVDGKEYESEYGVFSGYKAGDRVEIAYNPKDPKDIAQPNGILLPIGMTAAGAAALIGGVVSVINTRKKRQALKQQEEEWTHG